MIKTEGYSYLASEFKRQLKLQLVANNDIITIISPADVPNYTFDVDQILLGGVFEALNTATGKFEKVALQPYITDFYYIPDTTVENKLFICIEAYPSSIGDERLIGNFYLDIWVFTQKTNVMLNDFTVPTSEEVNALGYIGNRIDATCSMIEYMFRGGESFGLGKILADERGYLAIGSPTTEYYGKKMRFNVKGFVPREKSDTCGN